MTRGYIEINKLRIFAHHGVHEQEGRIGNTFEVSIILYYPINNAMVNDNISGTINYADVIQIIKQAMTKPSNLLENVIERIRVTLLNNYPLIEGGKIKIAKLSPPITNTQVESVAVGYEW